MPMSDQTPLPSAQPMPAAPSRIRDFYAVLVAAGLWMAVAGVAVLVANVLAADLR